MRFTQQQFGQDIWTRLAADKNIQGSQIPALILHDQDDHDVPPTFGKQLADAWPNSQLHLTHGLGHRRILRNTKVIKLVSEYIIHHDHDAGSAN